MDRPEGCEAAASSHRGRRLPPARFCEPLGSLERSAYRRMDPAQSSCLALRLGAYHDCMPVLLEAKDFDVWLDGRTALTCSSRRPKKPCANGKCRHRLIASALAMIIRRLSSL